MPESDVYLLAALCCETFLEERDSVISLIRVIDYIQSFVPPQYKQSPELWTFAPASIEFFLSLKSRDYEGTKQISVKATHDAWAGVMDVEFPLTFIKNQKQNYHLEIPIFTKHPGTVWIQVFVDGAVLVKVPFEIEHVYSTEET